MSRLCRVLVLLSAICSTALQAAQTLTALPPGQPAPDFTLLDTTGTPHRLADYRGHPVIINFWTTWCPPCREEIPSMNRAWQVLRKDGVIMLGVNMGEDEDTIFLFSADYPADFPLLMDRDGKVIEAWPVMGLPTTYIVAPDGTLAYRAIGGRNWDDPQLLEQIRSLLR